MLLASFCKNLSIILQRAHKCCLLLCCRELEIEVSWQWVSNLTSHLPVHVQESEDSSLMKEEWLCFPTETHLPEKSDLEANFLIRVHKCCNIWSFCPAIRSLLLIEYLLKYITAFPHADHQGHCEWAAAEAVHSSNQYTDKRCQFKDYYFPNGLFRVMSVKQKFFSRNQGAVMIYDVFRQASKMQK